MNPHPRGVRLGHLSHTTAELFAKTENQQLEKGMQCLGQNAASQSEVYLGCKTRDFCFYGFSMIFSIFC